MTHHTDANKENKIEQVKKKIRAVPDFPIPGILFRDICPVLYDPPTFRACVDLYIDCVRVNFPDATHVAGLEARGFIFGPPIALELEMSFVCMRKRGKLPGEVITESLTKEYGVDAVEIQKDALNQNSRVVIVDDLLATGGSLTAGARLVEKAGAVMLGAVVLIELDLLRGKEDFAFPCHSIITM